MFDDDLPKKKPESEFPRNLENMSVDDLEEYVGELRNEIARVEMDMEKKRASRDAADSIFK